MDDWRKRRQGKERVVLLRGEKEMLCFIEKENFQGKGGTEVGNHNSFAVPSRRKRKRGKMKRRLTHNSIVLEREWVSKKRGEGKGRKSGVSPCQARGKKKEGR